MHCGLPLYRQEKMFAEPGIELSRQTMSRWLITCADKL
jgi:transposase